MTYSEYNRRITGQTCCCKGDTGAQGETVAQGSKGETDTKSD